MKILIEPGGHYFYNMGDLAMLMVTVQRIEHHLPEVDIFILTLNPEECKSRFPTATPVSLIGSQLWDETWFSNINKWLPKKISQIFMKIQYQLKKRFPRLIYRLYRWRLTLANRRGKLTERIHHLDTFLQAMMQADVFIISGQGGLTDNFGYNVIRYLNLIDQFKHRRKPVVMFGQGIGPVKAPHLLNYTYRILPKVNMIGLREKKFGQEFLHKLAIDPHRIFVTGDDALELVFEQKKLSLGDAIGLNLRVADYSFVTPEMIQHLQDSLCHLQNQYNTTFLPIPINLGYKPTDSEAVQMLLSQCLPDSDEFEHDYQTPYDIIQQVSRCRVVITGSYHAAIFALGQGIPVIGLVASDYYYQKFVGLVDLYDVGIEVVLLYGASVGERLTWATNYLWEQAETLRPHLLKQTKSLIDANRETYSIILQALKG